MATYTFSVDWYGPFKGRDEARKWVAAYDYVPGSNSTPPDPDDARKPTGLYLAIGGLNPWRLKPLRILEAVWRRNRVQYVGLGTVHQRLRKPAHPIATHMWGEPEIWVGALSDNCTPSHVASIDDARHDNQIVLAEWLLIYFLQPTLNKKGRSAPPPVPCTIVNRWFRVAPGSEPQVLPQAPHPALPEMIVWPHAGEPHSKTPGKNWLAQIRAGEPPAPVIPFDVLHAGLFFVSGRDHESTLQIRCKRTDASKCRKADRGQLFSS